MKSFTLNVKERDSLGTKAANRVRKQGCLPAVFYGHGEETVSALLDTRQFLQVARLSRSSQTFDFQGAVTALSGRMGIAKEVQKNSRTGEVLHVDFQLLKEGETITVEIPLEFEGLAYGVKNEGGILSVHRHELKLDSLPKAIPEVLKIDVSELRLGDSIHARDLQLPDGVELTDDGDETLVTIAAPTVEEEKPVAEEVAEGAAVAGEGEKKEG